MIIESLKGFHYVHFNFILNDACSRGDANMTILISGEEYMASIWLALIVSNIIISIIPIYVFRKTKYIFYFICQALLDPLFITLYYLFDIPTYYFMPFSISLILLVLPYKNRRYIILGVLTSIFLIPYLYLPQLLPATLTSLASIFIIIFLFYQIKDEINTSHTLSIFLLLMILNTVKDHSKVLLYYVHSDFLRDQFGIFLIASTLIYMLLAILGPNTKVSYKFLSSLGLIDLGSIPAEGSRTMLGQEEILYKLTRMELRVLSLLGQGLQSKQIAEKLFVSPKTVYFHCNNLKSKLGIPTTSQLIKYSFENRSLFKDVDKPSSSSNHQTSKTRLIRAEN